MFGRFFLILLLCSASAVFGVTESEILRRCSAHLLIGDSNAAIFSAHEGLAEFPESLPLLVMQVKAYAAKQDETNLLAAWERLHTLYPEEAYSSPVLEEVAWSIVKKGNKTSALGVRLISLLAAAITQDAQALPEVLAALQDSCAPLRAIAVEVSSHFKDQVLKEEIISLFYNEKHPEVRLSIAKSFGQLHIPEMIPVLFERLRDPGCFSEEKEALVVSLAHLQESIDHQTLEELAASPFAVLRLLAVECIIQLDLENESSFLLRLLEDHNPDVRAAAIKGIGLLKVPAIEGKNIVSLLKQAAKTDAMTAIAAGWALLLIEPVEGTFILERYLVDKRAHIRALAAAAIASAGHHGIDLAKRWIEKSEDLFVRANLALALIGQRVELEKACAALHGLFKGSQEKWMWKKEVRGLFNVLQKSDLRHNTLIPNYPEVASQAVHLDLLNLLAILEDPHALEAIKEYMMRKQWEITGIAAEMLLGEGDESAIELIRQLLEETDREVRLDAALALAIWGKDHSALPVLMELYDNADKMTKIKIMEALGRVGDRETLPFLVDKLKTPSQTLRIVAAACVIMLLNH